MDSNPVVREHTIKVCSDIPVVTCLISTAAVAVIPNEV